MNGATMHKIFNEVSFLKTFFRGIIQFRKICMEKINSNWNKRDFIIINVQDAHWVVLMWIDPENVILFDTLSGKLKNV